jgi:hypothetical protein
MSDPTTLSPPEQEDVLREIATTLVANAPQGWQGLEFTFTSTVGIDGASFVATTSDGAKVVLPSPTSAMRKFGDLRTGMYQDGKGSWFTARLVIHPPGRFQADFDYDNEPGFVPPLTASAYALDFDHFPRSPEHTPDWLRAALDAEKPE